MTRGSITLVCGTRPELIKLAPLIRRFGKDAAVVYTGQHYDQSMYSRIRQDIAEPGSFVELGVGGGRRGAQLGNAVAALDAHFAEEPPGVVIVQGDTTSALAGALAANANDVPLVHVEAGLRSYDRAMPEEHNRVAIDHLADLCCAPTPINFTNLVAEGVAADRITVTGNTVVEALEEALPAADESRRLIAGLGLKADSYVLATIHRPENVDCQENLGTILGELAQLPLPVVLPLHPRTAKQVAAFGLGRLLAGLHVLEPQSYKDFLSLARWAAVLVSDSGGVQEEVSVLKRPVVVVRRSTERPEIEGTFGTLVPPGPRVRAEVLKWLDDVSGHRTRLAGIASPYGTGSPSGLIEAAVRKMVSDTRFASPTLEFQLVTEG